MLFFEICTFASYAFVSKSRAKGHGISLFLVMESHEKSWNLKSQKEYEPCVMSTAWIQTELGQARLSFYCFARIPLDEMRPYFQSCASVTF